MHAAHSPYPAPRVRPLGAAPRTAELFGRVESTEAEVTLSDSDSTVFTFSGSPQLIALSARTFGALFTLTDRGQRETHEVVVLPNQRIEVRLSRERVLGRNLVGGSNAAVFVEGFYAAEDEPTRGRRAIPPGGDNDPTDTAGLPHPDPTPALPWQWRSENSRGFRE